MSKIRAFTLIELLVVIIIIATLASAIVPAYGKFLARTRFEAELREVRDLCAHARERAIARDTTVQLTFDAATQTFAVIVPTIPPPTDMPIAFSDSIESQNAMNPSEALRGYRLPPDVAISNFAVGGTGSNAGSGTSAIRFRSDGSCDAAQFRLDSQSGYNAQLLLLPGTGQVKIEEVDNP